MTKTGGAERICRVSYEHLGAYQVVNSDFFSLHNQRSNFKKLYQQIDEE